MNICLFPGIQDVVEEIKSTGGECTGYVCDVANKKEVYRVSKIVKIEVGNVNKLIYIEVFKFIRITIISFQESELWFIR